MTTGEEPFVVIGQRGTELVSYTAASAVAAAAVAEYLRCGLHPVIRVEWALRHQVPPLLHHPQALKAIRRDWRRTHHHTRRPGFDTAEHTDEETTLIDGTLSYAGSGYRTTGDQWLALTTAAHTRERRYTAKEERSTA